MLAKPTGTEWMELNISTILNTNCTPTSLSIQGSTTIIVLAFLLSHHIVLVVYTGKTLIDTQHPLTNNTMLTHLVQLANLWMDWFL